MDVLTLLGVIAGVVGILAGAVQVIEYLQKRRAEPPNPSQKSVSQHRQLVHLRQILTERFSEGELQTLCFDLAIDYENVPGESKADSARELIEYLKRRDRIPELIAAGERLRPDIPWRELPSEPGQPIKPLHNLPQPDYGTFVGREAELAQVHRILQPYPHSQVHMVTIDGIGGIGKSALALEVARHYLHNYDHLTPEERFEAIIWTSAKSSVLTADGIAPRRQAIRTLDDIFATISLTLEREDITQAPAEERGDLVRRALARERTLLIVDNLETVDDEGVNVFLRELPAPAKAIVTTRHRIDVAYPVRLTGMSQEDGLALIAQECARKDVTLTQAEAEKLFIRTGGLPLAIVWSIAQMGFGFGVETTLRRLGEPASDIAGFCFQEVIGRIRGTDAHRLLLALSLFAIDASREALGLVAGLSSDSLSRDEGLVTLEKWSLVNKHADRFSLLPLTRSYLAHEAQQGPGFIQGAFERQVEFYTRLVTPPLEKRIGVPYWDGLANYARAESLEQEWGNLNSLIRWALDEGRDAAALDLFLPLVHLLHIWGLWDERLELSRSIIQAAQKLQDPSQPWLWIDAISYVLRQRQEFAECLQALTTGRSLATRLGLEEALILADVYEASLKHRLGEFDAAREKLDRVLAQLDLDAVREHGPQIRRLIVRRTASEVAALSRSQGDYVAGKRWHEIELEFRRLLGENDAPALSSLAHVSLQLNDVASAEKYLAEMPALLGKKDEAWNSYEWALLAEKKGEWQEARYFANLALQQFTRLGYTGSVQLTQDLLARLPDEGISSTL